MVNVSLVSTKGNHVKWFPYTGLLGLTHLKVEGAVRTRLDADLKPLPASSVIVFVRCYETRIGLLGVLTSNILVEYSQTLWSAGSTNSYSDIGDLELPFRINIPPDVGGFSTASYASVYKCTWRVEVIVNHIPLLGVGAKIMKHSELPLIRFDVPHSFRLSTPPALTQAISHPHLPPIRYAVEAPKEAIGPLDLVPISIQLSSSSPVTFRSASVIVERRLTIKDPSRTTSSPTSHTSRSLPIPQQNSSPSPSPASSFQEKASTVSSTTTITPAADTRATSSSLVNHIAAAESSGQFALSASGVWSKTLTLQWPAAKSHSRWAIGESIESELVAVRFFARIKLVVSSSHGTESVELAECELFVVSTNEAERQLALSKYDQSRYSEGGRSKSKSPRRSHRQSDTAPPLPASGSRVEHPHRTSVSTSYSPSPSSYKPPRRPHTSAGPRDKTRLRVENPVQPIERTNSDSSTPSLSSPSSSDSHPSDEIKEWEEELAQIELRSRRSSDLVAMARTRRLDVPS
ncbi:hypothetical protein MIND_01046200 [Mycena indigotica]|uniref:Uncharacterized protein n=1 Tax=Mycena indigotica TaxID=2126181 RepID=A0A8H6VV50_9AGAR|nr:uncharacterized protein MIND_01046200 [Mycena indigotica]KAF7295079.1 hypothetical protein MIND_01046200 [Mycena indigotica]